MNSRIVLCVSIAIYCATVPLHLHAQSDLDLDALYAVVKSPYAGLDTSMARISTGYLADKAVDLVKLPLFDGSTLCDSNYVNISAFRDLFRTMNYARVNGAAVEYDADSIYGTLSSSPYVKLGSALFQYNRIRGDAVSNGLIEYNSGSGSFSDRYVGGVWQNPYKTERVFMFTASRFTCESIDVTFDISDLTSWCNAGITSALIDFGDGLGYVSPGVSSTRQIYYSSPGEKELKLKISLPGGVVLESHTRIDISLHPNYASGKPVSDVDSTFTVSAGGVSALCCIKYASAHGRVAKKPFIYVEGFDHPVLGELTHLRNTTVPSLTDRFKQVIHNILSDNCRDNYYFGNSCYNTINTKEYDLFYVDWNNPEADINLNAQLLKEVIRTVNACKPSDGSGERTVIVGHSMGGLIARVTLRQMELDGEPHQVGCFVSQDSPHYGANVPIGVQYSIRDVYRALFGQSGNSGLGLIPDVKTFFDKVVGVLDCTSARQMMYNYVNSSGDIDNSVHQQWQSYLNTIGFPQGDPGQLIENLTIVSGNGLDATDISQKILSFGFFFVDLKMLLEHSIPAALSMDVQIDRDRQAGTLVSKTVLSYNVHSEVLHMNIAIPIMFREHCSPGNIGHYDVVPGSYLGFSFSDNTWLLHNPFLYLNVGEKVLFVPAASAFAVENYGADFYTDFSVYENSSPFGSFCLEQQAQRHDSGLSRYIKCVDDYDKIVINCPQVILSDDVISASYAPIDVISEEIQSLSSSNAVINTNSGSVTVINPGLVTIKYKAVREDTPAGMKMFYRKHRRVLAGFPSMTLSTSNVSGDQFMVTAECVSNDSELRAKVAELLGTGDIKYIWGIKNSNNSYSWTDTTSVNYHYVTAQNDALTSVCFKMYNGPGRESAVQVRDIDRRTARRYMFDPQEIVVDGNGCYMNYMYISGLSSYNYLAVWCNPSYQGTAVVPDTVQIGMNSYSVETSFTQVVDGNQVTVYCFDILDDPWAQQSISDAMNGTPYCYVPLIIKGSGVRMPSVLPIVSVSNP